MKGQGIMEIHRAPERGFTPARVFAANAASAMLLGLSACGGGSNSSATAAAASATPAPLTCDDSMKTAFRPDANTSVLLVKAFKKGDALLLSGTPTASTLTAANDLCVVKLNVGPGNPGPAGMPSTSPGIGIEIWLPTAANWNNRIHVKGGGGWAGLTEASVTQLAGTTVNALAVGTWPLATISGVEGAVSASTDTGHVITNGSGGSFAMNPDGTISSAQWTDFSERAIHEMALKTKALTNAYYGKDAKYAYFVGTSLGGRQAHKEAQANPADFDGILAGFPSFNLSKLSTGGLYPRIVEQVDFAGTNLTAGQLSLVSNAAIGACDSVGGQHLGYIPDPSQCKYDPAQDVAVLCTASGGTNSTANCVSTAQATAMNKMWYGQTPDGSVPSPAADIGFGVNLAANQKWFGFTRGTDLGPVTGSGPLAPAALQLFSDFVTLEMQNPLIGLPSFQNATGNGTNGWMNLSYAQLSMAFDRGVALQSAFHDVNTDNADLSAFRDRGGKMIMYHGLADIVIPPQGSINYYNRVAGQMGGIASIQKFYRFYLAPGMSHGFLNGTANPSANPPLPTENGLYDVLTGWVENGTVPGRVDIKTSDGTKSRPLCVYPQQATYSSGDPNQTASYGCS
jgi:feruloyl esterase